MKLILMCNLLPRVRLVFPGYTVYIDKQVLPMSFKQIQVLIFLYIITCVNVVQRLSVWLNV